MKRSFVSARTYAFTSLRLSALAAVATGLLGCESLKPMTYGEITVGRPQVFTRERLLNERLEEVNWVRTQRDKRFEPSLQGIRDMREASAFVLELQAAANLGARRAAGIQADDADKKRARDEEIAEKQHLIAKATLDRQLKDLLAETTKVDPAAPVPDAMKTELGKISDAITDLNRKITDLEAKVKPPKVTADAAGKLNNPFDKLPSPLLAEKSMAEATSRDRVEDEAAHRDFLRAKERELIMDDTHDMNGYALYELKFDAAIVPGSNSRRLGVAELRIAQTEIPAETVFNEPFYDRMRFRTEEDANVLINRLHARLVANRLGEAWRQRLLSSSPTEEFAKCEKPGDNTLRFLSERRKLDAAESRVGLCLVADYIKKRMESALRSYFDFGLDKRPDLVSGGGVRPFLTVDHRKNAENERTYDGMYALRGALTKLQERSRPWVATVEPKEYAQNISDVASLQKVRQIGATLGVSDGKGASVDAAVSSYKKELSLLQAIKRQPLATSFSKGHDTFGWVLGPKFEIRDEEPIFVHSPARYIFTASVVVPGWMGSVQLYGCSSWVEGSGSRSHAGGLFGPDCSKPVEVNLPHNHRAVLMALMGSQAELFQDPEVFLLPQADPRSGTVTMRAMPDACVGANDAVCEQTLVIEGRELWRNPAVFVGDQKADAIELLPSMRGLVAKFKSLRLPPAAAGAPAQAQDLLVVTSTGQDRLERAVFVTPISGERPAAFARMAQAYLERADSGTATLVFNYPLSSFPRAYTDIMLRHRPAGASAWVDSKVVPTISGGQITFVLDPASLNVGNTNISELEFDLVLRYAPNDEWATALLPANRTVLWFPDKSQRSLEISAPEVLDFSFSTTLNAKDLEKIKRALTLKMPAREDLFFKAYPGLEGALGGRGGSARYQLRFEDQPAIELDAVRVPSAKVTVVQPTPASISGAQSAIVTTDPGPTRYAVTLTYRRGAGEWTEVPLKGTPALTVKGRKKPADGKAEKLDDEKEN